MKVKIGIDGIEGQWDIDIPDDHPFIKRGGESMASVLLDPKNAWHGLMRWVSGRHPKYEVHRPGAVMESFESVIRKCITEEMTVDILPEVTVKDLPPTEERIDCPPSVYDLARSIEALGKRLDAIEAAHPTVSRVKTMGGVSGWQIRHLAVSSEGNERVSPDAQSSYWGEDGRCIHCGAGNDAHHSYTCPTGMHPDRREDNASEGG